VLLEQLIRRFKCVKREDASAALTVAAVNTERYVMYGGTL